MFWAMASDQLVHEAAGRYFKYRMHLFSRHERCIRTRFKAESISF